MLPLLHAFNGCDKSFVLGKGKQAFINAVEATNVATDTASVGKELQVGENIPENLNSWSVNLATVVFTSCTVVKTLKIFIR